MSRVFLVTGFSCGLVPPISEPYQDSVGRSATMHSDPASTSSSDPAKVAGVVLQIAAMDSPPQRLLLGSDARRCATATGRALLDSDERWRELSASADHSDTDPRHDPMAILNG